MSFQEVLLLLLAIPMALGVITMLKEQSVSNEPVEVDGFKPLPSKPQPFKVVFILFQVFMMSLIAYAMLTQ